MDWKWKTIIEPFKIKSVEPLGFTTRSEREDLLKEAHYNLFKIPADKVLIDLLTDSGTSAMSSEQWSALMRGDESYAGARSFYRFERVVKDLTGFNEVLPVHQGRAAEKILFPLLCNQGDAVLANTHFDTTRANVEAAGAEAIDLPTKEAFDFNSDYPFKGNIDLVKLEENLKGNKNTPIVILTLTNNSMAGQPVSMENIKKTKELCKKHGSLLYLDVARFAENAYFIKLREKGYENKIPLEISREMFSYADGCWMSSKKDALVNIGGFLATNDLDFANKAKEKEILTEGFPTYGGLAGRDLEAMAQGLQEVLDEEYLKYRITSIKYIGEGINNAGVPIIKPTGGHAVYVDAKKFLPDIPQEEFPGQALACALYLEGGIRSVEVGSLMFGKNIDGNGKFVPAEMELLRLAIPRRVYTQSHGDFIIEVFNYLADNKDKIKGLKVVEAPPVLSHFSAKLELAAAMN